MSDVDNLEYWRKEYSEYKKLEETTTQDWFKAICTQKRKHIEEQIKRLTTKDKPSNLSTWRKYHGR